MKPPLAMILPLLLEVSILRVVTATDCPYALGVESGAIRDNQFSASSSWGSEWQPWEARLNSHSAWHPIWYSTSEWLQVDLLKRTSITGIKTQGDRWRSTSYYVTSFKLLYSDNGADLIMNWNTFQENGSDKVFEGNRNANGVKTNNIDPPIVTRFIRLMAVTWERWIAFRLELLGCKLEHSTTSTSPITTVMLPTTKVETTLLISIATPTLKTTTMQTTPSALVTTYSMSSTEKTTEGITPAVTQRSTSSITSGPGVTSPPSTNTSGNSGGLAGNKAGTIPGAIIGGALAVVVAIIIIAILVSIFFIRRRRSKDTDDKESSSQSDETGTVDNIYYGGVTFTANGNASTNASVSIGQSEGMVDNHLYAGTTNDNVSIDQSEGTVDNHLYAGIGDACAETRRHGGDDSTQNNVYYNVAHTSDEGSVANDIYYSC